MKMKLVLVLTAAIVLVAGCAFFQKPDVPTGLTAIYNATDDRVEVTWDDVDGAREYSVYRGTSVDDVEEIHTGEDGSWDDHDYDYYQRFYAVEAKNDVGESGLSEVVEADIPAQDPYENDDTMSGASTIIFNEENPSQRHSIMPAGDIDYIMFHASPDNGYNIEVPAASAALALKLTLLDAAGTELAIDDDGEGDSIARIGEWTPSSEGDYYVKIEAKTTGEEGYFRIFFCEW